MNLYLPWKFNFENDLDRMKQSKCYNVVFDEKTNLSDVSTSIEMFTKMKYLRNLLVF